MAYSALSPVLGTGTTSATAIDAWLQSRAVSGAQYVGLPQVPIPADMGRIIIEECARYPQAVVNHDIVAAQIAHESAACQSRIARDKRNYSGYGASNDAPYLNAYTFATPREGVRVQVAHLLGYVVGDGPWNADSPRYSIVKRNGWAGSVRVLRDLEQKWAYTSPAIYVQTPQDQRYGAKVAAAANALTAFAATVEEPTVSAPPSGWKPPQIIRSIIKEDASNRPHRNLNGGSWDFITTHNTGNPSAGANAAMHAAWMHNLGKQGAREPSWHYTIDEGVIYQHMEDDWAGWHASDDDGPGNFDSLGLELVEVGNLTLVIWNAAWLVSKKMKERGKTDIAATVKQHNYFARDGKNCPRLLRANNGARWNEYLGAIAYFLNEGSQPVPEPTPDKLILPGQDTAGEFYKPDAGFVRGFKSVVEAVGAGRFPADPIKGILSFVGLPRDDEFEAIDGCVYQRCQRVILQYIPAEAGNPPFDIVTLQPDTAIPEPKA